MKFMVTVARPESRTSTFQVGPRLSPLDPNFDKARAQILTTILQMGPVDAEHKILYPPQHVWQIQEVDD